MAVRVPYLSRWLRGRRAERPEPVPGSNSDKSEPGPTFPPFEVGRHLNAPEMSVQVHATDEELGQLFEHIARAWTKLGEGEPYESVLYSPAYRMENIEKYGEAFYASGAGDLNLIRNFFARNGEDIARVKSVLEVGCGVGRVTSFLAEAFERVVSVDISASHIALARAHVEKRDCRNVQFVQVRTPSDYLGLANCNLFFSKIVLQHDPPPMMSWILSALLEKLREGDYCLFQIPTYADGYNFDLSAYLESEGAAFNYTRYLKGVIGLFEMHLLPQKHVHALFREHGVSLIECSEDQLAGPERQSMMFFGKKGLP
jgi:SAM-dependent methyltransferase